MHDDTMPLDTIVIGAGQAGLAAGYHLQRSGQRFVILEAGQGAGGAWPHYYESLRLFSPARFSSLPGMPFPGDPDRYPARDEVVAYLRDYAGRFRLPIVGGARVARVARSEDGLVVHVEDGRAFRARSVIAATGAFQRPALPQLPGQERYQGEIIHSFAYRSPEPFVGRRVVVVGAGNSAVQIAVELATHARVSLATRAPVRFVAQRPLGRDIHAWWWLLRVDTSPFDRPRGAIFRRLVLGAGSRVLDAGVYQAAIESGRPEQRPIFTHFRADGVVWPDGRAEAIDAVIYATGYRPNLGYLEGLGALDQDGAPLQRSGLSSVVPGLGYVGLPDQRSMASATLRGVGPDAELVVRALQGGGRQRAWLRSLARRTAPRCCPAWA